MPNSLGEYYPTLTYALESLTVDELKALLANFYTLPKPRKKEELVELALEQYKGDGLRNLWLRLDDVQKAAVAEVVHSVEDFHDAAKFGAKYGRQPDWSGSNNSAKTYGYHLSYSVLNLFIIKKIMPRDLKERLREFVPEPARTALPTLDEVPDVVKVPWNMFDQEAKKTAVIKIDVPVTYQGMERCAIEDIVTALRLVEAGKIAVSDKTRLPGVAGTKEIGASLGGGDFHAKAIEVEGVGEFDDSYVGAIRAFAWPLILQAGGLAEISGKKLRLTPAGKKALQAPPADTLRSLWKKWVSNSMFDELRRIDVVKGQTGQGQHSLTAPSRRRFIIAQALSDCPPERWVETTTFRRYMRAMGLDFDVTRNPWSLYLTDANYGSLGDGIGLQVVNSRYLLCVLFEYAATLGLIDVGYIPPEITPSDYGSLWGINELLFFSRYDGLLYFRLNALGAYCLGLSKTYVQATVEGERVLRVLANHDIVLVGERLSAGDKLLLEVYAESVSEAVWRLDQPKLLAAIEAGNSISKLREFLESRNAGELPATTVQLLADIERRSELLVEKGGARLIECKDGTVAALIANDTRTRKLCQRAGERSLVVLEDQMGAFRRALRAIGYVLPTVSR